MMGAIASRYADEVVLTSDNPRHEEAHVILSEIVAGVSAQAHVVQRVDRKAAIHYALSHAARNDIVLIAGKGHENYQQIGSERFDFSDQVVVQEWLHVT